MDSYYSYIKEENDDDSIFYTFYTNQNLLYTAYFDVYAYQNKLESYPHLLNNGFAFGFFKRDLEPYAKKKQDSLIFPTILAIIKSFISDYGEDTVLLYHCDTQDEKHPFRDKLFSNWEQLLYNNINLFKQSLKAQIKGDGSNKHHYVYLGFITSKSNSELHKVKEEFEAFSLELGTNKG